MTPARCLGVSLLFVACGALPSRQRVLSANARVLVNQAADTITILGANLEADIVRTAREAMARCPHDEEERDCRRDAVGNAILAAKPRYDRLDALKRQQNAAASSLEYMDGVCPSETKGPGEPTCPHAMDEVAAWTASLKALLVDIMKEQNARP